MRPDASAGWPRTGGEYSKAPQAPSNRVSSSGVSMQKSSGPGACVRKLTPSASGTGFAPISPRTMLDRLFPQEQTGKSIQAGKYRGAEVTDMSDQPIAIKLGADQTAGHGAIVGSTSDDRLLKALSDSGKQVRIRIPETDDTEGHALSTTINVVVSTDDDDVEGHAMSIHFPSIADANDFRRRVTAAGLITATIAISAVGATAAGSALIGGAGSASTAPGDYAGQYVSQNLGGTLAQAEAQATNLGQYTVQNPGGTLAQAEAQASNLGQYTAENPGGTLTQAEAQASNLGQYTAENPGGTLTQAEAQASNLGQYTAENPGGTLTQAEAQASNLGQYTAENPGGTLTQAEAQASNLGQYTAENPGGTPAGDESGTGQYNPDNMGGTPQAPKPAE